ncbi:MAG: DNA repair protein RecO [Firmicutes bacterium]|nr:DNA repair protein RecO [Bacillota bacterium]
MKQIKVRGLVLREYEAGESDKRLVIFCKELGRLMVYARGARKPTSRFMSAAQLFTYADFVLTKGQGFYSLGQAEIIESFYPLREDYDRLMTAHLVAEVCEKTLWDNIESDELLRLALKSLSVLAKGILPPLQVACVFLFKFLDVHGLRPQTDACITCATPYNQIKRGGICAEGLVCETHRPMVYQPVSMGAVAAMQHILENDMTKAFQFTATDDILNALRKAADLLWKCHFEYELKTGV